MKRPLMTDEAFIELASNLPPDFRDQGTRLPPVVLSAGTLDHAAVKAEILGEEWPGRSARVELRAFHKATGKVSTLRIHLEPWPRATVMLLLGLRQFREESARYFGGPENPVDSDGGKG